MRKSAITIAALAIAFTSAATAAEQSTARQTGTSATQSGASNQKNSSTSASAAKGALSQKDSEFIKMAATGGMKEVHMGQMAEKQGQSQEVKELGRRLVQDHTNANKMLMGIAQTKGVSVPKEKMDHGNMSGANFDKEFLTMMLADHQKDIAAFEAEAKSGDDADVKGFAKQTLPTLKEHLSMVKKAQSKVR
jgi:putative membrane protein